MKHFFLFLLFLIVCHLLSAQTTPTIYTVKADSTKLTGCDSNELIIENHSQTIPGFLYNTGRGRTAFRRPLTKISDTFYLVGADTLKLRNPSAWVQGGNSFGTTGHLGTKDRNNLDLYAGNIQMARLDTLGEFLIGGTTTGGGYKLDVNGPTRVTPYETVTSSVGTNITLLPYGANGYGPGIDASLIGIGPVRQ